MAPVSGPAAKESAGATPVDVAPFLERYRRLLHPGGVVHLKTDEADLVDFAEQAVRAVRGRVLAGSDRLAGDDEDEDVKAVQTTYEKRYRDEGRTIYDRKFRLD